MSECGEDEQGQPPAQPFCGSASPRDYCSHLMEGVTALHAACKDFPRGEDFEYHKAYPGFDERAKLLADNLLKLVEDTSALTSGPRLCLRSEGGLGVSDGDLFQTTVDLCDRFVEGTDKAMEELRGEQVLERISQSELQAQSRAAAKKKSRILLPARRPPNDSEFRLPAFDPESGAYLGDAKPAEVKRRRDAISNFQPMHSQWKAQEKPFNEGKGVTYVDTPEQFRELVADLEKEDELAVDLEAHNNWSFQGFLCLMQISTRSADFVVDVLELWNYIPLLRPIFENPCVVKVMHGASGDVVWLQRDFGIFVVNLFDTFWACVALEYPRKGLDYLLETHCGVSSEGKKMFQRADWRVRPLSTEMQAYARQDTQYLLGIYDRLRVRLSERVGKEIALNGSIKRTVVLDDPIKWVIEESRKVSLIAYSLPPADFSLATIARTHKLARGERELTGERSAPPSREALGVARELLRWRDAKARSLDISTGMLLTNATVLNLAVRRPKERLLIRSALPFHTARQKENLPELIALMQSIPGRLDSIVSKSEYQEYLDRYQEHPQKAQAGGETGEDGEEAMGVDEGQAEEAQETKERPPGHTPGPQGGGTPSPPTGISRKRSRKEDPLGLANFGIVEPDAKRPRPSVGLVPPTQPCSSLYRVISSAQIPQYRRPPPLNAFLERLFTLGSEPIEKRKVTA